MSLQSRCCLLLCLLAACRNELPPPDDLSPSPQPQAETTLHIYTHGPGTLHFNSPTDEQLPPGCTARSDGVDCKMRQHSVLVSAIAAEGYYFAHWNKKCGSWQGCAIELIPGDEETLHAYFAPQVCRAGWCWENPGPQGNDLRDLWGINGKLWAVGKSGTILYFDGEIWQGQESNTFAALGAIWGTAENDIWAAGTDRMLVHFDGTAWTVMSPPPVADTISLRAGLTLPNGKQLIVGTTGTILTFDSTNWQREASGTTSDLFAVYASGDFIITAGDKDTLLKRDAAMGTWGAMSHPAGAAVLNGIWGDGASDIWVVGNHSILLHYDGKTWTAAPSPYADENIVEIWGPSSDNLWAAFWHSRAEDPEDVPLLHYDGNQWTMRRIHGQRDLWALYGRGSDELWAVSKNGAILRARQSENWTFENLTVGLRIGLTGVYAASQQQAWAIGQSGTLLKLSAPLQPTNEPKITEQHLHQIAGRSESDLWVVGDYGTILQFNGATWSNVPAPGREHLNGIVLQPGSQHGWAVGEKGRVLPLDYTQVGIMAFDTTQTLQGAWVSRDGKRLLASGTGGRVAQLEGGVLSWLTVASVPANLTISAVTERRGQVIGIGGWFNVAPSGQEEGDGYIFEQSSPTELARIALPNGTKWLRSIDGVDDDLWTVGYRGTMLHWQENAWRKEPSVTHQHLQSISYCTAQSLLAVGDWGTILRRGPRQASACVR